MSFCAEGSQIYHQSHSRNECCNWHKKPPAATCHCDVDHNVNYSTRTCLKVVTFNCRSIRNKTQEILSYLDENNVDIAVLQETWLNRGDKNARKPEFYLKSENIFDPFDDFILNLIQNFTFEFILHCNESRLKHVTELIIWWNIWQIKFISNFFFT